MDTYKQLLYEKRRMMDITVSIDICFKSTEDIATTQ